MSRRLVYRLIYAPCLIALAALVVAFAHPSRSRGLPTTLQTFTAADNSFRIDCPADWQRLASSQHGTGAKVRFQRDENSEIVVTCDLTGSLMLDINRNGSPLGGGMPGLEGGLPNPNGLPTAPTGATAAPEQKTPLQSAHESGSMHLKGEFKHYKEQSATPTQAGKYEALTTAFTAQTTDFLHSHDVVGKRVTVLAGNHPVTLDAYCSKGEEDGFFATFDAMLKTLRVSETAN